MAALAPSFLRPVSNSGALRIAFSWELEIRAATIGEGLRRGRLNAPNQIERRASVLARHRNRGRTGEHHRDASIHAPGSRPVRDSGSARLEGPGESAAEPSATHDHLHPGVRKALPDPDDDDLGRDEGPSSAIA